MARGDRQGLAMRRTFAAVGAGLVVLVIISVSPSTSMSLSSTLMVTATSSTVFVASLTIIGGSLSGAIVIVTVATLEKTAPSITRYVNVSTPV